jgi:hypothetical protein
MSTQNDTYSQNMALAAGLAPGLYIARSDARNPSPDRRKSREWRSSPVFPAGEIYSFSWENYGDDRKIPRLTRLGTYQHLGVSAVDESFTALIATLEPYEPKNTAEMLGMLEDCHNIRQSACAILDGFVASGLLTLAMVRRMAQVLEEREQAEYEAEEIERARVKAANQAYSAEQKAKDNQG